MSDCGFGYDPEVPAGFQDADIEMRELEQAAERARIADNYSKHRDAQRKAAADAMKTPMQCNECGRKFKKSIDVDTFEVKCPKCGGYDTEPI